MPMQILCCGPKPREERKQSYFKEPITLGLPIKDTNPATTHSMDETIVKRRVSQTKSGKMKGFKDPRRRSAVEVFEGEEDIDQIIEDLKNMK